MSAQIGLLGAAILAWAVMEPGEQPLVSFVGGALMGLAFYGLAKRG